MVLNLSFVCSLFMLWLNVKKRYLYLPSSVEKSEKFLKNQLKLWLLLLFMALASLLTCCDLTEKRIFLYFFDEKKVKMVSQSRLYFALLASVATMAFWMGMWRDVLSGYLDYYLDTWISRPFWLSKYPDPKKMRHPNIQISGY